MIFAIALAAHACASTNPPVVASAPPRPPAAGASPGGIHSRALKYVMSNYAGEIAVDFRKMQGEALRRLGNAFRDRIQVKINPDGSGKVTDVSGRELLLTSPQRPWELHGGFTRLANFVDAAHGDWPRPPVEIVERILAASVVCSLDRGSSLFSHQQMKAFQAASNAIHDNPADVLGAEDSVEIGFPPETRCKAFGDFRSKIDVSGRIQIPEKTAYVVVDRLSAGASERIAAALNVGPPSGGKFEGVILDLRNNQGGLVLEVSMVAGLFVGQEITVKVVSRDRRKVLEMTKGSSDYRSIPLVVLVNRGTSSGGDVLATALKQRKRAFIVGEKTDPSAAVQMLYDLPGYGGLKLTTALVKVFDGLNECPPLLLDLTLPMSDANGPAALAAAVKFLSDAH